MDIYIYGLVKVYQTFQICKFSVIISKNEILNCQHIGEQHKKPENLTKMAC